MEILSAATTLFFNKGYASVSVDEIGEQAGTTGPAIYRHFRGKSEILAALFDQAIDEVLSATGSSGLTAHAELEYRVRAHALFVLKHYKLASVWIREGMHLAEDDRRRLHRRENAYISQWASCIRATYPSLDPSTAQTAALTAIGTLNCISNWPVKSVRNPGAADFLAEFVLRGLTVVDDVQAKASG